VRSACTNPQTYSVTNQLRTERGRTSSRTIPSRGRGTTFATTRAGINASLNADTELDDLKENAGLIVATERRANPRVNVTVVNASTLEAGRQSPAVDDHGRTLSWGPDAASRDNVASTSRVVKLTNASGMCDPVCWLVVRVW